MDILLEIVSQQKFSASFPTSHLFGEAGGYIGRSDECEWVLPDRSKQISRKHALITFEDGEFYLEDTSSNGVFLSLDREPVGKGRRYKIMHGEGFVIGGYTIMARLLHNPRAYASPERTAEVDLLSPPRTLSSNPLAAMDEEEDLIARQRLGEFDDLLGDRGAPVLQPSDHNDPRMSTLQPVVPVYMPGTPGISMAEEEIPADWDSDPDDKPKVDVPVPQTAAPNAPTTGFRQEAASAPHRPVEITPMPETDVFFKALGFAQAPDAPEERERILVLAAQLLATAVEGMTRALQNRNECKNELRIPVTTTGFGISNNPLKFSPTAQAALATLLGAPQKGVLPPVESMREGFDDLHSHHMGLLAGARAAVRASLEKISPLAVEARLDANGPVRLGRTGRLWHTYNRMHRSLQDDHEGFAAFFLQDFSRAYEVQVRTLHPSPLRDSQGGRP